MRVDLKDVPGPLVCVCIQHPDAEPINSMIDRHYHKDFEVGDVTDAWVTAWQCDSSGTQVGDAHVLHSPPPEGDESEEVTNGPKIRLDEDNPRIAIKYRDEDDTQDSPEVGAD
jgi:hypothetical protein